MCREKELLEAEASLRNSIDRLVKTSCKVVVRDRLQSIGILPTVSSITTKSGCKFGAECSLRRWKVEEQPNKKPQKGDDKSAVAILKSVRQLRFVSQDIELPDSTTISWKGIKVLGPVRRVRFTRAALRQANIRVKEVSEDHALNLRTDLQERLYKLEKGRQSCILFTF